MFAICLNAGSFLRFGFCNTSFVDDEFYLCKLLLLRSMGSSCLARTTQGFRILAAYWCKIRIEIVELVSTHAKQCVFATSYSLAQ